MESVYSIKNKYKMERPTQLIHAFKNCSLYCVGWRLVGHTEEK